MVGRSSGGETHRLPSPRWPPRASDRRGCVAALRLPCAVSGRAAAKFGDRACFASLVLHCRSPPGGGRQRDEMPGRAVGGGRSGRGWRRLGYCRCRSRFREPARSGFGLKLKHGTWRLLPGEWITSLVRPCERRAQGGVDMKHCLPLFLGKVDKGPDKVLWQTLRLRLCPRTL